MNFILDYIPTPYQLDGLWYARISRTVAGNVYVVKQVMHPHKYFKDAFRSSISIAWERTLQRKYGFMHMEDCPLNKEVEFVFYDQGVIPILRVGSLQLMNGHLFVLVDNGTYWHLDAHPSILFREIAN